LGRHIAEAVPASGEVADEAAANAAVQVVNRGVVYFTEAANKQAELWS
jgi:hypothetical protein